MLRDDCKRADFQMFDKTVRKHQKKKKKKRLTVSATNSAGLLAFWGFSANDLGEKGTEGLPLTGQILIHQLWVKRRLPLQTQKTSPNP